MNIATSTLITDSIVRRHERWSMQDAINEASCLRREFSWLDTHASASLDRKHGQMRMPGLMFWQQEQPA